jgi:hypothetical protein
MLEQLSLDLGGEVEQVHHLRKSRPGHLTNPREFCLIGYHAVIIKPLPIDRRYRLLIFHGDTLIWNSSQCATDEHGNPSRTSN